MIFICVWRRIRSGLKNGSAIGTFGVGVVFVILIFVCSIFVSSIFFLGIGFTIAISVVLALGEVWELWKKRVDD